MPKNICNTKIICEISDLMNLPEKGIPNEDSTSLSGEGICPLYAN